MTAASRALPLRRRPDLSAQQAFYGGQSYWIVKDPLALKFFRLRDLEYEVLQNLNAASSPTDIRRAIERRFAPVRTTERQVMEFVAQLDRLGLLVAEHGRDVTAILAQAEIREQHRRRRCLAHPWAIRFRGIDPQRFLDATYPVVRILLSIKMLAATLLLMGIAATSVVLHWHELVRELVEQRAVPSYETLGVVLAVIGVVKVFHELGHAYACRHYGGRVTELGLLLFLGCPSLYCNVSDSWMIASKWKRIAVAAAGIYVEMVLAALATIGWLLSSPGGFHDACLTVMAVCSVNTLLFNGNPLMRYDGYFMLADFTETPNLAEVSARCVRERLLSLFLCRSSASSDETPGHSTNFLFGYGILSAFYRSMVIISIYRFLLDQSRSYNAESLVRIGGVLCLAMYFATWFRGQREPLGPVGLPSAPIEIRIRRVVMTLSLLLFFTAFVPLPKCVIGRAVLQTRNAEQVIVQTSGTLYELLPAGARVAVGDTLARLGDDQLALEVIELAGDVSYSRAQLQNAERQAVTEDSASLRCAELRESLASLERQLDEKEMQLGKLTVTAMHGGVIVSPPEQSTTSSPASSLRGWQGIPQDRRNVGCTLEAGTLLCEIVDPAEWDVVICIDESDVQSLTVGQAVEILLDQRPQTVLDGQVVEIALQSHVEPLNLSQARSSTANTGVDAKRADETRYQVRIAIAGQQVQLRRGLTGFAKIHTNPQSLASRAAEWFYGTFYELL